MIITGITHARIRNANNQQLIQDFAHDLDRVSARLMTYWISSIETAACEGCRLANLRVIVLKVREGTLTRKFAQDVTYNESST